MAVGHEKIASTLESLADYVNALEAENARLKEAHQAEENKRVEQAAEKLASQIRKAIGEDVDPGVAKKIASSDDDTVELIKKLASREEVDSLGSAKKRPGSGTEKVASEDEADERFASWILT